jgi:hypothetical protein
LIFVTVTVTVTVLLVLENRGLDGSLLSMRFSTLTDCLVTVWHPLYAKESLFSSHPVVDSPDNGVTHFCTQQKHLNSFENWVLFGTLDRDN